MAAPGEVGDLVTADYFNNAVYRPYCKVHQTVAQTALAEGVDVVISFTTEDYDPLGWHDNVTNNSRIKPTLAGEYEVIVQGAIAASTTLNAVFISIYQNGALYTRGGNYKPGANETVSHWGGIHIDTITMNGTTDYVEMALQTQTNGAVTWATNVSGSGASRIIMRYLGPTE